jgi:four helix bundle protein
MEIRSHRDLLVWQKALDLVVACYELSKRFPDREKFGLSSQLQQAAVSVPANIAEGHGRRATRAYVNHLSIANGSLAELETHVLLAVRLGYVTDDGTVPSLSLIEEVRRMLASLRNKLSEQLPES